MKRFIRNLAAAGICTAVVGGAMPAVAQDRAPEPNRKAADPNEMICEKLEVLGSRLSTKRVCMTRAQWADARSQDRQEIEKVQVQRSRPN